MLLLKYAFTFGFSFILKKFNVNQELISGVLLFLNALFYMFILLGLTYKKVWSKTSLESVKQRFVFSIVNLLLLLIVFGLLAFKNENDKLYAFIKNPPYSSQGLFKTDSLLGYAPKPNNIGYHRVNNDKVNIEKVVYTNNEGRRISLNKYPVSSDSMLLFLGCSFTWGDYSIAEETYPYLTSKELRMNYINAGVSGYGLAQMYLLAKEIIPQNKPIYVIVQYSPWLVDRAISGFTPTHFGTRFSPYFTKTKSHDTIVPPHYLCYLDEIPFSHYRHSKSGFTDRMTFICYVSSKVILAPYFKKVFFLIKQKLGIAHSPNTNKEEVEKYFYSSLYKMCKKNNSKLVVVSLDEGYSDTYTKKRFKLILPDEMVNDIYFVQAQQALFKRASGQEDYQKRFYQQQNGIIYDDHPNYSAASIIANELINTLKTK